MTIFDDTCSKINTKGLKVAILGTKASNGLTGGAERFYDGLLSGFLDIGCQADFIGVNAEEPNFETIIKNYEECAKLDLKDYDLVVSTKVPTYAVSHPNHVLYLVHTVRVFDDMFDQAFKSKDSLILSQRSILHKIDYEAISRIKARYSIGHEVANRLYRWRGLKCEVIHPPLGFNNFKTGEYGDYFFLPGRLHSWKRIDLVINAIRKSDLPLKLVIAGTGEAEKELRAIASNDNRIQFVGRIDDERLVQLYSDCLAVPFTPLREDYGYVTLEAFASGKPVLTCTDSGEPCRFVSPFETGLVVEPSVHKVREGLEWLWNHRDKARLMGKSGLELVADMSWAKVAYQLAKAGLQPDNFRPFEKTNVCVLDMQPIDPPIGGGRQRLLGLYHNLGSDLSCTYVGTYDWPGESYRSHMLSSNLKEIDVPLSEAHHEAARVLSSKADGKVVIDLAFSQQAYLSPDYLSASSEELKKSQVVIFSHPWTYPLVKDQLRPDQILIYDSQNVEGYLRAQLLNENNHHEADLLRQVVEDENELGWHSDWILTCSHEDLLRFNRVYGFPIEKMRIVPNGVMAYRDPIASPEKRQEARQHLRINTTSFLAIFIGSAYGPNIEAANFIAERLAPMCPNVTFVIAGGVGNEIKSMPCNVLVTGQIDEDDKNRWFYAADIAINPMLSGSGTNIKMFDFMSKGLPVVTTVTGARGIETAGRQCLLLAEPEALDFSLAIEKLRDDQLRRIVGAEARACVEEGYSWEHISAQLGCFIDSRRRLAGQSRPLFSIVVPTYERHSQLDALISCIEQQVERDFEVVLVDQSAQRWAGAEAPHSFPLTYFHSPVKGAVRARNTGAMLAQGSILAFVDDDCLPEADWLANARNYFCDTDVVGVEGIVYSDHLGDPDWRPVSNVGLEGIGFMTANLFVRSSAFQYLGGFDLQFDHPHFREDTDFGWRLLNLGKIPYAKDVRIFHPAQPRNIERESSVERLKFFQKDAILYKKHPQKYQQLFAIEQHFINTPGFTKHLIKGFENIRVPIPAWISDAINSK